MYGANKRSLHLQQRIFLVEATEWKSESGECCELRHPQKKKKSTVKNLYVLSPYPSIS